jgi:hypothetical protein
MGLPFTAAGKRKPQDRHLFSHSKAPGSASEKLLNKINSEPNTDPSPLNGTVRVELPGDKRQENFHLTRNTPYWGPSQVSMPKNRIWRTEESGSMTLPKGRTRITTTQSTLRTHMCT